MPLLRVLLPHWNLPPSVAAIAVSVAAAATLAGTAALFKYSRRAGVLLLAGLVGGSALLLLR